MNSPFKFLDPYELEDRDAFFGRDAETRALYSLVSKNRLTFVYGPSGTGKTSLVQCGLAALFGGVDWLPLFVRKGEDINDSLRRELSKAAGKNVDLKEKITDS
ncbi:MAG TPA: AAA family ATPase, partial [Flavilitoribacter sp.]|nr:AAA family ATPase [Flavilitoribacter sp.]